MTDTVLRAIIGVGGAIVGALLAGPVTYYFSKKLIQQNHKRTLETIKITDFNKAAAAFRAEFAEILFYLRQNIEKGIGNRKFIFQIINTKDLIRYENAVIRFEPFLNECELGGFSKAWKNCKEYMQTTENEWADRENPADTTLTQHIIVNSDKGLSLNQKYLNHINLLLSYAKRK